MNSDFNFETKGYDIGFSGYEDSPDTTKFCPQHYIGKFWLSLLNGKLYTSNGSDWIIIDTLKPKNIIPKNDENSITQEQTVELEDVKRDNTTVVDLDNIQKLSDREMLIREHKVLDRLVNYTLGLEDSFNLKLEENKNKIVTIMDDKFKEREDSRGLFQPEIRILNNALDDAIKPHLGNSHENYKYTLANAFYRKKCREAFKRRFRLEINNIYYRDFQAALSFLNSWHINQKDELWFWNIGIHEAYNNDKFKKAAKGIETVRVKMVNAYEKLYPERVKV